MELKQERGYLSQNKGVISELVAQTYFTKKGYIVSKPINDCYSKYDIIIDNGVDIKRVQIKTAYWDDSRKSYMCKVTSTTGIKRNHITYTPKDIDILCAVEIDTNFIYLFPIEFITTKYYIYLDPTNKRNTRKRNIIEQYRYKI